MINNSSYFYSTIYIQNVLVVHVTRNLKLVYYVLDSEENLILLFMNYTSIR